MKSTRDDPMLLLWRCIVYACIARGIFFFIILRRRFLRICYWTLQNSKIRVDQTNRVHHMTPFNPSHVTEHIRFRHETYRSRNYRAHARHGRTVWKTSSSGICHVSVLAFRPAEETHNSSRSHLLLISNRALGLPPQRLIRPITRLHVYVREINRE